MLKIKLARFGKRNQPHYRIVVTEARSKRDGKYTESLGQYAPTQTPKILNVDTKAYEAWVVKGAQPTETVAALFKRFTSGNPFPDKPAKLSKKAKTKKAEKASAEAEAASAPVEDASAESPSTESASEEATATEKTPDAEATSVSDKSNEAPKSESKATESKKAE